MIRFAKSTDALRIAEIHVAAWRVAYRGRIPDTFLASLSVKRRAEEWRQGIATKQRLVLLSEREGQIDGWISIGSARGGDSNTIGEIYAIYVHPDEWSHGIGRELMAKGEEELRKQDLPRIVLWVLESNDRARRFYETLGYQPDSRTKEITIAKTKLTEVRYSKHRTPPTRLS